MKKFYILLFTVSILIAFVFAKSHNEITITGSTTVLPITQKCAELFMQHHKDIEISVRGGGSSVGIAGLLNGSVDIADASRPMKEKEIEKAKKKGINPIETIIAKDGIAVIVNKKNKIKNITIEQIEKIYTGEITNWKELGGADLPIIVISRDISSGTYEAFEKLALHHKKVLPSALNLASNKACAATVTTTEGAIAYIGLGYVNDNMNILKVNGIIPTQKTVINGTYPLSRPLYIYTNGKPKGNIKLFIDFILSNEGQKIVKSVGYIPIQK